MKSHAETEDRQPGKPAYRSLLAILTTFALLTAALTTTLTTATTAAAASLALTPTTNVLRLGDSIFLDLRIDGLTTPGAPALGGFDLQISFDDSVLDFEGAAFGDPGLGNQLAIGGFSSISMASAVGGSLSLFELSLTPSAMLEATQADGFTLATLQFRAVDLGDSLLQFGPGSMLSDAAGGAISIDSLGSAHVSVVPEPTAALLFASGLWIASQARRRN